MSKIRKVVQLLVEIPDVGASEEDIREFIEFETGYRSQMRTGNPLNTEDFEILECYIEDKEVIY